MQIVERMSAFARAVVVPHDWRDRHDFPMELWRGLAGEGLLAVGLPAEHGGVGGWPEVAAAARALAADGGNLGIALSWALHPIVGSFVLGRLGDAAQRAAWLPGMARGERALAIAVSEPGVGAHPKHLKTSARRDGGDWLIDGEKTWLTNGTFADGFVVLAASGERDGRRRYSAFLVPADAAGLARTAMAPIDFLRPSPHCGLRLDGVRVPAAALLGAEGEAFAAWAGPLRVVEDALMASAHAGAVRHQLRLAARLLGPSADEAALEALGEAEALLAALEATTDAAAAALAAGGPSGPRLLPLADGARLIALGIAERLDAQVRAGGGGAGGGGALWEAVTRDIVKALGIARAARAALRRRRGLNLLAEGSAPA